MRVALLLITGLGIVVFIKMPFLTAWDFRNNLWGPAYLLLHGRSPYDIAALFQCCNAVWFPMIIGLLFPLGWLAQSEATNLWLIANLAMLIAVVWLSLRARRPPLRFLTTALILAFIFPSTVSHLVLGQLTLAVVLLALIVARLTLPPRPEPDPRLDRGLSKGVEGPRPMLAGAMAALALAKPQLAILFIPGLMLTFARIGGRRAVALFLTAITATTALLVLPLYAGYPAWPDDFLATVRATPEWAHPSLLTLLDSHLGTMGLIVWGIIFTAGFGVNLWLWRRRPAQDAMNLSLALTAAISPYIQSWDFVMLLPLTVQVASRLQSPTARLALVASYWVGWASFMGLRFNSDNSEALYWWVPWLALAALAGAQGIDAKWNPAGHP